MATADADGAARAGTRGCNRRADGEPSGIALRCRPSARGGGAEGGGEGGGDLEGEVVHVCCGLARTSVLLQTLSECSDGAAGTPERPLVVDVPFSPRSVRRIDAAARGEWPGTAACDLGAYFEMLDVLAYFDSEALSDATARRGGGRGIAQGRFQGAPAHPGRSLGPGAPAGPPAAGGAGAGAARGGSRSRSRGVLRGASGGARNGRR
eukprot:tig00021535_g22220.t1